MNKTFEQEQTEGTEGDNSVVSCKRSVEMMVADDIAARSAKGVQKYGFTVAANPLPLKEWLRHAYEESLDLPIYLKRAILEIEALEADNLRRSAEAPLR